MLRFSLVPTLETIRFIRSGELDEQTSSHYHHLQIKNFFLTSDFIA